MIKERQENVIHGTLSAVLRQRAGCVYAVVDNQVIGLQ
jgi:hypothetical protein